MTFNAFNSMGIIANGTLGANIIGGPLSGLQTGIPSGGVTPSNPGGTPIVPGQVGGIAPAAAGTALAGTMGAAGPGYVRCTTCNLHLPTFKTAS